MFCIMLTEIMCEEFKDHGVPRGRISLHAGLNTVMGSSSGSNSIGKSTFLMIIDFIFGGDDYIEKLSVVQTEVGEHRICFTFRFEDGLHHFYRSNVDYKNVQKCDENYYPIDDGLITLNQYLSFLQEHYHMNLTGLTFRNAIGRSMRIYKRETLDEERPLHQAKQETSKIAIEGLLKLLDLYSGIQAQSKIATEANDMYTTFKKAQKYQYIPFVAKQSDYNRNKLRIEELSEQAEKLVKESSSGFLDIDSMQAEQISILEGNLSKFKRQRTHLTSQLRAIQVDQNLGKGNFSRDYDDLLHFFPNANIESIEAIEAFHKQLAGILKKEFSETEDNIQSAIALVDREIVRIENEISAISKMTELSEAVLEQYASIDNELKVLRAANENYTKNAELFEKAKAYKGELDRLIIEQMAIMQQKINDKMADINNKIYGGHKTAPKLIISDASHYRFFTPRDDGTGTQYKGLIVFDLAMLELTCLPVIAHDSILLKQIEDEAIEEIVNIYSNTPKQIFIAIDKEGSYTPKTRDILENTKIIQVGPGEGALFGRTWNNKENND